MSDTSDPRKHELTIELRDVVREYKVGGQSVRALDGISLRLTGGQFVSVVGPSGAGKSTLLHLLGALDSPDSGSITFDGEEIGRLTDGQQSEFRHHRVGFIFQFFNLLPTLSAWENVAVPKLLDGVRLGKVKPDAVRLLDRVGLSNRTPTTSRIFECRPSAPISRSPSTTLPFANSTRTPSGVLATFAARQSYWMWSVGKPANSRSSSTRRGTMRTDAPSRSTIAVRSKATSGRPADVTTRTVDRS